MSLVDYASSSDDDDDDVVPEDNPQQQTPIPQIEPPKPTNPLGKPPRPQLPPRRSSVEPLEKLPDASLLLNSPSSSATDHASRVASRKRDPVSGMGPTFPRSKIPRGTLPHSKNVPDTVGGILVPPQLGGRRNIVTEDIGKLFVSRHKESPSN